MEIEIHDLELEEKITTDRVPLIKEDGQSAISDQADAIELDDLAENI